MSEGKNVLLVGVGGQGILLASEVISQAAMNDGFDVKKSEIHGMAQRGGVVSSHVRYAERVYSPLIMKGTADVLVSFEKAEAYRWLEYLKPGGMIVTNTTEIIPPVLNVLGKEYPHDILDRMKKQGLKVVVVDASDAAEKLGNPRAMNMVLLGAISDLLGFTAETWHSALNMRVPKKHLDLNLKAFEEGRKLAKAS
ncbi:MAG: indolepyruvate oxidoreductase subunit beta [Candidatus Coatesbacteria bacterium]|nr:indolepyruvate oxidoreductase subunit beta [Candidatus Coatesbacteria bacterium]